MRVRTALFPFPLPFSAFWRMRSSTRIQIRSSAGEISSRSSCRSLKAVDLICSITRCARGARWTVLQRRSCEAFLRATQRSPSSRCSKVTRVGSSMPRSDAISACVKGPDAADKCINVRHFAWLRPIGFRRSSSFNRHARAVPWRSGPKRSTSLVFTGSKFVSLLTNSRTKALSMPANYSIFSSRIDSFR